MLTWLTVNVVLSVLALVFIALNGTAPHRLRFFAGFAALVAWLAPWPLLPDLLPANMFSFELWRIERAVDVTSARVTGVIPVIVATSRDPLTQRFIVLTVIELGFAALSFIGCVLFVWKVIAHQQLLRRLERKGGDGNWLWARAGLAPVCPVHVQRDIAGAFSSGLLRPRIWVHGDLVQSPQLATLLRHELTHIRQHDNWYLLVTTFVERVFWWNPLVWYLGRSTRELQELSCDELCQRLNSDYPAQLAQLMIDAARGPQPRMLALGANIFNNPNPNVKRIQLLQRSYPMLKKHILAAAVTAGSAFLAVGFVTAQPDGAQAVLVQGTVLPGGRGSDDQFMRINSVDGEEKISFSFTDTPLPGVLMPLVGFVSNKGMMAGLPHSAGVAMVHELHETAEQIYGLSPDQVRHVVEAEGGTATFEEEGRVVSFAATRVAPGAGPGTAAPFAAGFFAAGPLNENLVLEYPDAANKFVSVSGTDLSIEEAIDLIAEESGCNIFRDGDSIVVDYCDE